MRNVLLGGVTRVPTSLDRILLSRQAEGVPAHGVEHVKALGFFVALQRITGGVAFGVTNM